MLREIYCRNADDPGYNPGQLETGNAIEALLTKIRMIMFTRKGEVLGEPNLGINLEDLLFNFGFNGFQIEREFYYQLAQYVPDADNYSIDVKFNFTPGTVRDICYVDIYINGTKYLGVIAK